MVNKETLDLFANIYNAAYRCIIYTHYFEMVDKDIEDKRNKNKEYKFWIAVQNTFADEACLYWTHVFGSHKKDNHLHYKHFFGRADVLALGQEFSKESVKKRILSVIGYDNNKYDEFWGNVKLCRNKFLAHKDIHVRFIYPDLIICRKMTEELLAIFKELLEKWLPEDKYNKIWQFDIDEKDGDKNTLHMYKELSRHKLYEICLLDYNARND